MKKPEVNWNLVINEKGVLMTKADNIHASYREVVGIRPAYDIKKEEFFDEFLSQVRNKNFDEALILTYKY